MDIEALIKSDMKSLGCESELQIAMAYQLFVHLSETIIAHDVQYFYSKELEIMYLKGKLSKKGQEQIYVPVLTSETISLNFINKLQSNLCKDEGLGVTIACLESDSTIVLYTFSKGIVDVSDSSLLFRNKNRDERRKLMDIELNGNRQNILKQAIDGGVVDNDEDT